MEDPSDNVELSFKLQVTFPSSSEDHRLQLVGINGAVFAILHAPLESQGPIRLFCEDWSLVLLAPIKSKTNVVVTAINIISFSEVTSDEGNVNVHASNRLVKFSDSFKAGEKVCQMGERGESQFDNDPGALLYFYRLFEGLVGGVRSGSPEMLSQAQQQFIAALCTLADKMQNKTDNLDLKKVLEIWKIPILKND